MLGRFSLHPAHQVLTAPRIARPSSPRVAHSPGASEAYRASGLHLRRWFRDAWRLMRRRGETKDTDGARWKNASVKSHRHRQTWVVSGDLANRKERQLPPKRRDSAKREKDKRPNQECLDFHSTGGTRYSGTRVTRGPKAKAALCQSPRRGKVKSAWSGCEGH